MHIGIDLMGGEHVPSSLLQAIHELVAESSIPLTLSIFASSEVLEKLPRESGLLTLVPITCPETITMEDDPLKAIRSKKNSSMIVGIQALKEGKIDAFVSTGNTGALVAASTFILGRMGNPALLAVLPTKGKPPALIDAGAFPEQKTENLVTDALLGLAYQKACGNKDPKIALLNIGIEEHKGSHELKKAYTELKKLPEFTGNIEGRDAFDGEIDVLVTDGFTGNVFLKTAEGVASMLLDKNFYQETIAQGAVVCGVNGIVIKCHGNARPEALKNGLTLAQSLTKGNFLKYGKAATEK